MGVELWSEKYRPRTFNEYVWKDTAQRTKVEEWVSQGGLPHLLLSGTQGTGKTSLAKLLLLVLEIPEGDILEVRASKERKIDDLQDRIINFASTWALNETGFKYVILDEADSLSPVAQRFLRGEMDNFEATCRFIMTCNYPNRIIPALHSRLQEMKFSALERDDFTARAGEILTRENAEFDVEDLLSYVELTYPDLRKCIQLLDQNTTAGKLGTPPSAEDQTDGKDYLLEMAQLFKQRRFLEARKMIVSQAQLEEYPDIFRYFYRNLALWGQTQDQQNDALLIIRRGLLNHGLICDAEINLAATIVELSNLSNS